MRLSLRAVAVLATGLLGCPEPMMEEDAGPRRDAGVVVADAGMRDAGAADAGTLMDAGAHDGGAHDGGALDAGVTDAGSVDAGLVDGGVDGGVDAGSSDGGRVDAGALDAGPWCSLPGSYVRRDGGVFVVPGGTGPSLSWLTVPEGFCAHHYATVGNARQLRFAPGGELFVASPTAGTTGGGLGIGAIVVGA